VAVGGRVGSKQAGTGTSDDTGSLVSRVEIAEGCVNVSAIAVGELKQQCSCSRVFLGTGPGDDLPPSSWVEKFISSFPLFVPHSFLAIPS